MLGLLKTPLNQVMHLMKVLCRIFASVRDDGEDGEQHGCPDLCSLVAFPEGESQYTNRYPPPCWSEFIHDQSDTISGHHQQGMLTTRIWHGYLTSMTVGHHAWLDENRHGGLPMHNTERHEPMLTPASALVLTLLTAESGLACPRRRAQGQRPCLIR